MNLKKIFLFILKRVFFKEPFAELFLYSIFCIVIKICQRKQIGLAGAVNNLNSTDMKIKIFEAICKEWGGYYECSVHEDGLSTHVTLRTCQYALFPDELKKIKESAKKDDFSLLYISCKTDGLGIQFIKLTNNEKE